MPTVKGGRPAHVRGASTYHALAGGDVAAKRGFRPPFPAFHALPFCKGVSTAPKGPPRAPGGTWPTCAMVQARSGVGSYSRHALITEMLMTDTVSGPRALSSTRRLQGQTWEARQEQHLRAQRKWPNHPSCRWAQQGQAKCNSVPSSPPCSHQARHAGRGTRLLRHQPRAFVVIRTHRLRLASALNVTNTRMKLLPMTSSCQLHVETEGKDQEQAAAGRTKSRSAWCSAHSSVKRAAHLASPIWSQMRWSCLCSWPDRGTLMPSRYLICVGRESMGQGHWRSNQGVGARGWGSAGRCE